MSAPKVYEAINNVASEMSITGISKNRKNAQQGYNFRGIDDVFNALSNYLPKHKLCILPRVMSRSVVERQTQKGGALFYTTLEVEFDFVSALDGSTHTIRTIGEAMDSADKSSNKAMSAAYKYACLQVFCIPTEGMDNDADAVTHEVAAGPTEQDVLRVKQLLQEAAMNGTDDFTRVWQANKGPARDVIAADKKLMASFKTAAEAADAADNGQQQMQDDEQQQMEGV